MDGRTDVRSYTDVITKFTWLDGLPNILRNGAPLGGPLGRQSSAINPIVSFVILFLPSERFLVAISKSDSTQKVNQPQKIENSTCVFTVSIHSASFKGGN